MSSSDARVDGKIENDTSIAIENSCEAPIAGSAKADGEKLGGKPLSPDSAKTRSLEEDATGNEARASSSNRTEGSTSEEPRWVAAPNTDITAKYSRANLERDVFLGSDGDGSKDKSILASDLSADSLAHLSEQERLLLRRRIYLIIVTCHVLAVLYSAAYWMQSGVLPYLTRKLKVGPLIFGYLQSTYAIFQFLGSPLFGRTGDVFGCQAALIVSFTGAALCYVILGLARSVFVLFLSRVPSLVIHSLQERSDMIGKLGISHGIGMIIGSFVGGLITEAMSEEAATFFAAGLAIVCAVLTLFFIPRDTKKIRRIMENMEPEASVANQTIGNTLGLKELVKVLKMKHVAYILIVKAINTFPYGVFYAMFSMSIMDFFHLGPRANGFILGYVGVLGMIVQGVGIGYITKRMTDAGLVHHSTAMTAVAFLFLIIVNDIYLFCVTLIPLVVGGSISHIIMTSLATKVVPIDDTGSVLGLTLGMHALIRIFAPTLGGYMFTKIGFSSFGIVGYIMTFLLSIYLYLFGRPSYN